eukprot:1360063-Lingulodinium_polyedra.AAC.1
MTADQLKREVEGLRAQHQRDLSKPKWCQAALDGKCSKNPCPVPRLDQASVDEIRAATKLAKAMAAEAK